MGLSEEHIGRIEARAAEVLAQVPDYIWDGESVPVPIEAIVDSHFGLHVRDVDDMAAAPGCPEPATGQKLSGLLLAEHREIWVNAAEGREWPGRRRFTLGHELGHWVLHREMQTSLFCRHGSVEDGTPASGSEVPEIEREANAFAAALLIPPQLLERHYYETGRDFEALCELFGSSRAAMGRRLHRVI